MKNYYDTLGVPEDASDEQIKKAFKDIVEICKKLQDDTGLSNSEVKILLKEVATIWETEKQNKFGFR